jgi:hypothetical protein
VLIAHTCNLSYSGGRDQEDHGLKPARTNSSQETISIIPNPKRAGRVAQVIEHPPRKPEALNSNASIAKKKKKGS